MPEYPYLVAIALVEQDGKRLMPIGGKSIKEVIRIDGIKLRLGTNHWLMLRFSGTEPLLRLYCEAPNQEKLQKTLAWAKDFAESR